MAAMPCAFFEDEPGRCAHAALQGDVQCRERPVLPGTSSETASLREGCLTGGVHFGFFRSLYLRNGRALRSGWEEWRSGAPVGIFSAVDDGRNRGLRQWNANATDLEAQALERMEAGAGRGNGRE